MRRSLSLLILWVTILSSLPSIVSARSPSSLKPSNHTSNHAIILSSSRFWFNYRHAVNALAIYDVIKTKGGIPDENIVLMLADDMITNPRNPLKNEMHYTQKRTGLVNTSTMQIDYRGDDVTVDNLRRVMLGKGDGRVLHTDANSNVLVYWTGHGGDSFFKFQDVEEITATDIARLFEDMEFQNLLFLADTCQAFTLGNAIDTPGVYMIGSSLKGENSYAHHSDAELGLSVIERYTFQFIEFLKHMGTAEALPTMSLQQTMVDHFDYQQQRAHVGAKRTKGTKPLSKVLLSDFFGNAGRKKGKVELLDELATTSSSTDWSSWKALSS